MEYPIEFLKYITQKLKPIAINMTNTDFDLDKDVFAQPDSIKFMTHGLHTLLEMQTSERDQRRLVLQVMVDKNIISEDKAKKLLT